MWHLKQRHVIQSNLLLVSAYASTGDSTHPNTHTKYLEVIKLL